MKLTCDQCGARYAISNEKIVGSDRVFKIRCKTCNAIMTIRGVNASDGSPNVDDESKSDEPDVEWYYAHEGKQVGPVGAADVQQAIVDGIVQPNTYVWRSGMSDWKPMSDVPELTAESPSPSEQITSEEDGMGISDATLDGLAQEAALARLGGAEYEETATVVLGSTETARDQSSDTDENDSPQESTAPDVVAKATITREEEPDPEADDDDPLNNTVIMESPVASGPSEVETPAPEMNDEPVESDSTDEPPESDTSSTVEFTSEEHTTEAVSPFYEGADEIDDMEVTVVASVGAEPTPWIDDSEGASSTDMTGGDPGDKFMATQIDFALPAGMVAEAMSKAAAESDPEPESAEAANDGDLNSDTQPEVEVIADETTDNDESGDHHPSPSDSGVVTSATLDTLFEKEAGGSDTAPGTDTVESDEMVWQRNENSVLFSLSDLDDSVPAPAPARSVAPIVQNPGAPVVKAGVPTTAESSLIDIANFQRKKQEKQVPQDLFGSLAGDISDSSVTAPPEAAAVVPATQVPPAVFNERAAVLPGMVRKRKTWLRVVMAMAASAVIAVGGTILVIKFISNDRPASPDPDYQEETQQASATDHSGTTGETANNLKQPVKPSPAVIPPNTSPVTVAAAVQPKPSNQPKTETDSAGGTTATPTAEVAKADAVPTDAKPVAANGRAAEPKTGAEKPPTAGTPRPAEDNKKPAPAVVKPEKPAKPLTAAERRKERKRKKELREKREKMRLERKERKAKAAAERKIAKKEAARKAKEVAKAKKAAKKVATINPNDLLKKVKKRAAKTTPAASGGDGLPNRLTSGQVRRVVRRAFGRVRSCAKSAGVTGVTIRVRFVISSSGGVGGVGVSGPAGSAAGCIRGAIARLRFPRFKSGSQAVRYPFRIN